MPYLYMPENNNNDLQLQYQQILNNYTDSIKSTPTISTPVISSTPKTSNSYKYFFYFSLIVFLVVFALVINSFLSGQKSIPAKIVVTPSPSPAPACLLENERYQIGQVFPSTDGCNTCSCTPDLTVVCTEKSCLPTPIPEPLKTYQNKTFNFSLSYPQSYKISDKLPLKYAEITKPLQLLTLTNSKTNSSIKIYINADGFGPNFANELGKLSYSPSSGTEISNLINADLNDYQSRNPESLKSYTGEYGGKIGDLNITVITNFPLPDDGQNKVVLNEIIRSITPQ